MEMKLCELAESGGAIEIRKGNSWKVCVTVNGRQIRIFLLLTEGECSLRKIRIFFSFLNNNLKF